MGVVDPCHWSTELGCIRSGVAPRPPGSLPRGATVRTSTRRGPSARRPPHDSSRSAIVHVTNTMASIPSKLRGSRPRGGSGALTSGTATWLALSSSRLLAVDEQVVGPVRNVDNRRGLRVAGAGRGDTPHSVEAQHLDDVPEQPGGRADLGCVEVQLGDVPAPLAFLETTLPVTALPSGACHCGGPASGLNEAVVDASGEVGVDVAWVKAKEPSACRVQA